MNMKKYFCITSFPKNKFISILLVILISLFLLNGNNTNATEHLLFAAEKNYLKQADEALKKGANITSKDYFGRTALMYACMNGSIEMARLLLLGGASANSDTRDRDGKTAYMHAREKGNQKLVEVLEYYGIKE